MTIIVLTINTDKNKDSLASIINIYKLKQKSSDSFPDRQKRLYCCRFYQISNLPLAVFTTNCVEGENPR